MELGFGHEKTHMRSCFRRNYGDSVVLEVESLVFCVKRLFFLMGERI